MVLFVLTDSFQLIWGPLSLATAVCIARASTLRHALQLVVSIGHLYGVALYYGTCSFEYHLRGHSHSRPEFLYYWIYYVAFNMPWVVVPSSEWASCPSRYAIDAVLTKISVLIHQSFRSIRKVFGAIHWIADKTAEMQRALRTMDFEHKKTR